MNPRTPRTTFRILHLMVAVVASAVFFWGCLGIAEKTPYHHLAIALSVAIAVAGLGLPAGTKHRAGRSGDLSRESDSWDHQ